MAQLGQLTQRSQRSAERDAAAARREGGGGVSGGARAPLGMAPDTRPRPRPHARAAALDQRPRARRRLLQCFLVINLPAAALFGREAYRAGAVRQAATRRGSECRSLM